MKQSLIKKQPAKELRYSQILISPECHHYKTTNQAPADQLPFEAKVRMSAVQKASGSTKEVRSHECIADLGRLGDGW